MSFQYRSVLCTHNAENTEITVQARRGSRKIIYPIEFMSDGEGFKTASMIAAEKYIRDHFNENRTAVDQAREHKLERDGNYVTRIRYI